MHKIGIDPGYGNFKAARVGERGAQVAVTPALVGVGEIGAGALSLGVLGRRGRRAAPDRVAFDGLAYLVGAHVDAYTAPQQRMDAERLADTPDLRALLYATVGALLGPGAHEAALIVGFPVHVQGDRDRAARTLRALRAWLVGDHAFTRNGEAVALRVTRVGGLAQPAGAFFAWALDDAARWAQDAAYREAPVGVLDLGFNTLDLFSVQGGEVLARYTGGDTAGMRRAAETLIAAVKGRGGETLALSRADALLRDPAPALWIAGERVDLKPLVKQALDTAAAGISQFVERQWGDGKQFARILFTGGGAALLGSALLRLYPRGVVLPDPVTANAVGLARYALKAFK